MRIAITTPTGNVGRKVAEYLLDAGVDVVLLARSANKVKDLANRGARVVTGAQDDPSYLADATRGADGLFWVTPPNMGSADLRAFQEDVGRAGAQAIRANHIPRVVNLSSIGAQLASGAGPISGLHNVERLLDDASGNITHLRCGYFFENFLHQLDSIGQASSIFLPISGSRRLPMIATRDIARSAVDRLLDASWSDWWICGLHGPADLSFDEAAGRIGRGIGRKVRHVRVAEDDTRRAMLALGMSVNAVESMLELFRAIESGVLTVAEPRTAETTTSTPLLKFAREAIAPLVAEPVGARA